MRTREQNFLAMAKTSIEVLNQNSAKWEANKRVKKAVTDAKTIIDEIETRNQGGLAKSVGATSQKQEIIDQLAELAGKITKRVKVYATDENNLDLKQKMSFTKSDYHHMSDTDLSAQIQNLHSAVSPLVADLDDYGITQPMLDELSKLATDFKTLESQPRTIITERKMHNTAIPELLKMLRADLQTIDGLIGIFEDDNLEIQYKNARIIIDRGVTQKKDTPETK